MINNRYTAAGALAVLIVMVVALLFVGWCANIVKFISLLGGEVTAEVIVRAVGIFAVPIGAILGFF